MCGPSSYTSSSTNSRQVSPGQNTVSGESFVLLFGQDPYLGKDLVFVSFRKSFHKDIVPAIISSWIKQGFWGFQ